MIDGLKPYPNYKDSGEHWLGQIPDGWSVHRAKNLFRLRIEKSGASHGRELLSVYTHIGVRPRKELEERGNKATTTDDYWIVKRGDIIVNKLLAWMGAVGVSHYDGVTSPAYDILKPTKPLDTDYYHHLFRTARYLQQFKIRSRGIMEMRLRLYFDELGQIPTILPPIEDQSAIVRFLDHADRRFRRYIGAKRRLIALLNEQKQAIIHCVVTRGLNPNASLKSSGINWLGDVPEHWHVRRLRNVANMLVSNVDKHTVDGEVPVRLCNYVDVYKNDRITDRISFMRASATQEELRRFRLELHDILITKDSETWKDIGVPSLVEHTAADLVCGYHLALLRPHRNVISGNYLLRALQSKGVARQFHVEANGVTRFGLSHAAIKSISLPIPPLNEQSAIVQHLDAATSSVTRAIDRSQSEISLLNEYRVRLIADVVMGKLDVRDVAAQIADEIIEHVKVDDAEEPTDDEDAIDDAEFDSVPEEAEA